MSHFKAKGQVGLDIKNVTQELRLDQSTHSRFSQCHNQHSVGERRWQGYKCLYVAAKAQLVAGIIDNPFDKRFFLLISHQNISFLKSIKSKFKILKGYHLH